MNFTCDYSLAISALRIVPRMALYIANGATARFASKIFRKCIAADWRLSSA